jgi:hypothetical protein
MSNIITSRVTAGEIHQVLTFHDSFYYSSALLRPYHSVRIPEIIGKNYRRSYKGTYVHTFPQFQFYIRLK